MCWEFPKPSVYHVDKLLPVNRGDLTSECLVDDLTKYERNRVELLVMAIISQARSSRLSHIHLQRAAFKQTERNVLTQIVPKPGSEEAIRGTPCDGGFT